MITALLLAAGSVAGAVVILAGLVAFALWVRTCRAERRARHDAIREHVRQLQPLDEPTEEIPVLPRHRQRVRVEGNR